MRWIQYSVSVYTLSIDVPITFDLNCRLRSVCEEMQPYAIEPNSYSVLHLSIRNTNEQCVKQYHIHGGAHQCQHTTNHIMPLVLHLNADVACPFSTVFLWAITITFFVMVIVQTPQILHVLVLIIQDHNSLIYSIHAYSVCGFQVCVNHNHTYTQSHYMHTHVIFIQVATYKGAWVHECGTCTTHIVHVHAHRVAVSTNIPHTHDAKHSSQ